MDMPTIDFNADLSPIRAECIASAGREFGFHSDILLAILYVEGGEVGKDNNHKYGRRDIGPAQLNTIHLPELKKIGITEDDLKNDGCVNVRAMAWYLSNVTKGMPVPSSEIEYLSQIARYHSKSPQKNKIYAIRLKEAFAFMYLKEEPTNE